MFSLQKKNEAKKKVRILVKQNNNFRGRLSYSKMVMVLFLYFI